MKNLTLFNTKQQFKANFLTLDQQDFLSNQPSKEDLWEKNQNTL